MKAAGLWKVAVLTSASAEEPVAALLASALNTAASTYFDCRKARSEVSVYVTKRPGMRWLQRQLAPALRNLAAELGEEFGRVHIIHVPPQDWAESWKRHFKPLTIGSKLLIKAPWSKQRPKKGQITVVLEPGLSFGTGHHPTTAYCLSELVRFRQRTHTQSTLDIGTGSGILAIAAARLGYQPVKAFDFDPDAVRTARANARANDVSTIEFFRADVGRLPRSAAETFSVVCANLISTLLVEYRDRILRRVAPDGLLVLAGILKSEFQEVNRSYVQAGWVLRNSKIAGEWQSGSWARKNF